MREWKTFFTVVLAALGCRSMSAQSGDTSIFFRYAATFDQLLPSRYYPMDAVMPDTASLLLLNYGPLNTTMRKQISITEVNGKVSKQSETGSVQYTWDYAGRVTKYEEFRPEETAAFRTTRYSFLIQTKLSSLTVNEGNYADTTEFEYNRSGEVGTWRRHAIGADSAFTVNGTRMYDSRQRLIVATNMKYGPLTGSYLYEYNTEGKLIRRTFLAGASGIVLCTDTLEYAYQSESKSILQVTHKLKVAGANKWTLLESKTMYPYSGVVLSYTDYNDADSNFFYRNFPEYTVRYEYDEKGRVSGEYFGTLVNPDVISANYYYSTQFQPDSIVYSERVVEKKNTFTRVYSRDVRSYDQKGRIVTRSITTYFFEEKKKKEPNVPYEVVNIRYQWQ